MASRCTWPLALGLIFAGCSDVATQLVVIVDTDYAVPEEMGHVQVVVRDSEGNITSTLERDLVADGVAPSATGLPMPFSFAVVPKDGDPSRRISVEVFGLTARGGRTLVGQKADTGFLPEKALALTIFLAKVCEPVWQNCSETTTCVESGMCSSSERPPDTLSVLEPGTELMNPPPPPGRDGGVDPSTDGGVVMNPDGGVPGVDGGIPPLSCTPPTAPTVLMQSITLPHEVDHPLLVADIDNDGIDEVIAASQAAPSAISVIDFDGCTPIVTTVQNAGEIRASPVLGGSGANAALWVLERTQTRSWSYAPGTLQPSSSIVEEEDMEFVSLSQSGDVAGFSAKRGPWGFLAYDTGQGAVTGFAAMSARARSPLAFLDGRFIGATDTDLELLSISQTSNLAALIKPQLPVVVAGRHLSSSDSFLVSQAERALFTGRLGQTGLVGTGSVSVLRDEVVSETVPASFNGQVRIYMILKSRELIYCTLVPSSGACSFFTGGEDRRFRFQEEALEENVLLTGYIDADSRPDPILITKSGRIHFAEGNEIESDHVAAPAVNIGREPSGYAALMVGFYDRFGTNGDLLIIPHSGGELSLIGWARTSNGDPARLWPQHRKDARRSALYE